MAFFTQQTYYAHGKLLLSAEYLVLDGALALALPTRPGQSLTVFPRRGKNNTLHWQSIEADGSSWFKGRFDLGSLKTIDSTDSSIAQRLEQILQAIRHQQPGFLPSGQSISVTTKLEFPRHWGLGTSSTLISALAQWSGADPYLLLRQTFGGSGYDIACAQADRPLFFQLKNEKPVIESCAFFPSFQERLFFLYLGEKQNSREGIAHYRQQKNKTGDLIAEVSDLSRQLFVAQDFDTFSGLLERHESLISGLLRLPPVKQRLFPEFWGAIKSLGAWGGDFVLIASIRSEKETSTFFNEKGFSVFFPYNKLIL